LRGAASSSKGTSSDRAYTRLGLVSSCSAVGGRRFTSRSMIFLNDPSPSRSAIVFSSAVIVVCCPLHEYGSSIVASYTFSPYPSLSSSSMHRSFW
jgi:hypothetical protein